MSLRAWTCIICCCACTWVHAQEWQSFLTIHDPLPDVGSNFGEEVRLHGDTLVVSAPGGTGVVYLFERNMGGVDQWELCQSILPDEDQTNGDPVGGRFGDGLAFNGSDLMIGSENGMWQYRRNSIGQFVRAANVSSGPFTPHFRSLAMEDRVLLGGGSIINAFRRSANSDATWSFVDATSFDEGNFESCVGEQILIHNNKVVISDPCFLEWFAPIGEGKIRIYRWEDQQDSLIQVLTQTLWSTEGLSASIAFDGDTILVGSLIVGDFAQVFAYVPDPAVGYIRNRTYDGYLGSNGGWDLILNVGYSLFVDGRMIITGTSVGVAFMEKDLTNASNWTLLRSDTLPGPVKRLERSGEWLVGGIPSARMVQLYRNLSVGLTEVQGPTFLHTYPVPAEDLVNVVLPSGFADVGMIQLWDTAGRLVHSVQVNGNRGVVRIHRNSGWTGMQFIRLVDMTGRTLSNTKVIWR